MTIRAFKVGGLRFLRIGRLQVSFCVCRPVRAKLPAPRVVYDVTPRSLALLEFAR